MPPVGDAVRLVHDEQPYRSGDRGKDILTEVFVGETLRRNKQNIGLPDVYAPLNPLPLLLIRAVDRLGLHADSLRSLYLVTHQGKQRRDEQRRPEILFPQQLRTQKVDHALSPSRPLHNEKALSRQKRFDALPLSGTKFRSRSVEGKTQIAQSFFLHIFSAPFYERVWACFYTY